jgi:hypothetical protein
MKTIEQLLYLSKNPYYKFTNDEQAVLDDFLLRKKEEDSENSQKKNSRSSDKNTPVRVRNIVEKTVPDVPDAPEPTQADLL